MPRVVVLQAPRVVLEQQRRGAGGGDLVVDRDAARLQVAGQPVLLAVEHDAGSGLVDVRRLAEQARVLGQRAAAPAAHQHELDVRAQARLDRACSEVRRLVGGVAEQRTSRSEQGSVEIGVEDAHGACLAWNRMSTTPQTEPWTSLIEAGREDGRLVRQAYEGARAPEFAPLPDDLHPKLAEGLRRAGIERLYAHQAQALEAAW